MKKTLALLLALVLIVAMAPAAFATSQSTRLTTTVPPANYTLNVPTDTVIPYNSTDTSIGYVTVTDSDGFATGKNLEVTLEYSAFTSENVSTKIPYTIKYSKVTSVDSTARATSHSNPDRNDSALAPMTFKGTNDGTVERLADVRYTAYISGQTVTGYVGDLGVVIEKSNWGKALAGDYTSTITFTASVVSAS